MNTQIYRFRAKYGYGSMEQVSFGIDELEKALYAQKYKVVVMLGGKQINGSNIIVIEKDFYYYTGWNRSYEPKTSDDFLQIQRDCPAEIESLIENTRKKIDYLIQTNQKQLIGKNVDIEILNSGEIKLIK